MPASFVALTVDTSLLMSGPLSGSGMKPSARSPPILRVLQSTTHFPFDLSSAFVDWQRRGTRIDDLFAHGIHGGRIQWRGGSF